MSLYERKSDPMLSRRRFIWRLWYHFLVALALIVTSVLAGMVGYHYLAQFGWLDSFLNSAMLLGGMGPVGDIPTRGGKLFAGFFSLYAGLVFIAVTAVLLTPIIHRIAHRIHLEQGRSSDH